MAGVVRNKAAGLMGMRATVYLVPVEACEAARAGDVETFGTYDLGEPLDLDKAWHAVHFILTGDNQLGLLQGGHQIEEIGETAQVFFPATLKAYCDAHAQHDAETLMTSLEWEEMNAQGIYPQRWSESARSYVRHHLEGFLRLLRQAVEEGQGMFVVIL